MSREIKNLRAGVVLFYSSLLINSFPAAVNKGVGLFFLHKSKKHVFGRKILLKNSNIAGNMKLMSETCRSNGQV